MKVEILTAAEAELAEAVSYYNEQCEGLGYEFAAEVKQTIARILRFPEAWTKLSARTSRCRTKRFPCGATRIHGNQDWDWESSNGKILAEGSGS